MQLCTNLEYQRHRVFFFHDSFLFSSFALGFNVHFLYGEARAVGRSIWVTILSVCTANDLERVVNLDGQCEKD